jgi:hypothetical protein
MPSQERRLAAGEIDDVFTNAYRSRIRPLK